jgi:hypothetical protein
MIPILVAYDFFRQNFDSASSRIIVSLGCDAMVSGLQFVSKKKRKASSHKICHYLIFIISFPITIGSSDSSDLKRTHTCRTHHLPDFYMWLSRRSASFGEESASSCKRAIYRKAWRAGVSLAQATEMLSVCSWVLFCFRPIRPRTLLTTFMRCSSSFDSLLHLYDVV